MVTHTKNKNIGKDKNKELQIVKSQLSLLSLSRLTFAVYLKYIPFIEPQKKVNPLCCIRAIQRLCFQSANENVKKDEEKEGLKIVFSLLNCKKYGSPIQLEQTILF